MTTRKQAAAATRDRIVQAAHDLLDRPDGGTLTLQDVAAAAEVSRATIYNAIGSRHDLLAAVFVDQGRLIGFDRVLHAMELEDPARAIVETVRESCRAWTVMPGAIRRTLALAVLDQEIGQLVRGYESKRREGLAKLARRAKCAGAMAPQLRVGDVAATLSLLTGFTTFDQLLLDHTAIAATEHLADLAERSLGLSNRKE